MKVLFILNEFPKLSETFILNQITGLIDSGIEVNILAAHNPNEIVQNKDITKYKLLDNNLFFYDLYKDSLLKRFNHCLYNLFQVESKYYIKLLEPIKLKSLRDFLFLIKYLQIKNNFDIVHSHYGSNGIMGSRIMDWLNINTKHFVSFYGYDLGSFLKNIGINNYRELSNYDLLLPICSFFQSKLVNIGFDNNKIKIHKIGINIDNFQFRIKKTEKEIILLTVARFVEKKGIQYGLEALSRLIKNKGITNIKYNIIGSGILFNKYKIMIKKLNIQNHVHFLGEMPNDEIYKYLNESDIFLLPSVTSDDGDIEGTPIVIMEAMASGVPVVSSYHSGIPELIDNKVSGMLTNEKNVDELTDALFKLITDNNLKETISINARKKIETEHDIKKLNNELIDIYHNTK
ncbi:MAG: glycosyltransferase [Thermodesulfobacteriota bacterium]